MSCSTTDLPIISAFPEFIRYRRELGEWVTRDVTDADSLEEAGEALCKLAHEMTVLPEQILIALHLHGPTPDQTCGSDRLARARQERAHRTAFATNMLLRTYFTRKDGAPPAPHSV